MGYLFVKKLRQIVHTTNQLQGPGNIQRASSVSAGSINNMDLNDQQTPVGSTRDISHSAALLRLAKFESLSL